MKQCVSCTENNVFHVHETTSSLYRKQLVSYTQNNLFHAHETGCNVWDLPFLSGTALLQA